MHPLTKLVVGKRSGEILPNSTTWKVRTERTQPLVVWPLVLTVGPLADEEREFLEWLASHSLARFATRIKKVACDLGDIAVLTDEEIESVEFRLLRRRRFGETRLRASERPRYYR